MGGALVAAVVTAAPAFAQAGNTRIDIDGVGTVSAPLQIVLLLTLLTFIPAILVTMTSFTRIVIVFHFLRQALGTQEMPLEPDADRADAVPDDVHHGAGRRAHQRRWPCSPCIADEIDGHRGPRARHAAAARRSC